MNKKRCKEAGISLLELSIAMLIIAILVSVVILMATGFFSEARETGLQADMRSVKTAVDAYVTRSSQWPTADGKLPPSGDYTLIDFDASFTQGRETLSFYPHFIDKLPKHHDEGVWRIDNRGSVSVAIDPKEY